MKYFSSRCEVRLCEDIHSDKLIGMISTELSTNNNFSEDVSVNLICLKTTKYLYPIKLILWDILLISFSPNFK
jgi:hypothetical protein